MFGSYPCTMGIKGIRHWGWLTLLSAWVPLCAAHADPSYNATRQIQASPEDLLDKIPFLANIPRSFIMGDGFKMRLSGHELRVDHMGYRSHHDRNPENCTFGFSYTTPVAGFFTYRLDLPLAHSQTMALEDWSKSSLGDYAFYFSRAPVDHPTIKLLLSARF